AVANLGGRIWNTLGAQSAVDRLPGRAGVVGAERTGGRDGDEHAIGVAWFQQDRVQAHATRTPLPAPTRSVVTQSRQLLPALAAVCGAKQGGVLDPGEDGVGIGQRGFEMPHARERPWVRRAVVPLMGSGNAVIYELVADRFPDFAAVVRALDQLSEPAAAL